MRQADTLDVKYIRKWLGFFDRELPEAAAALERFERVWRAEKRAAKEDKRKRLK